MFFESRAIELSGTAIARIRGGVLVEKNGAWGTEAKRDPDAGYDREPGRYQHAKRGSKEVLASVGPGRRGS